MARERQFCNIEPYCVLCRDTILYPEDSKPADLENWQQTAVGFCLPINSSNPVQFYVFRVDLRDGEWPRPSELLSSLQAIQDVRVRVTSDSGPKWPRNPAGSISLLHAVCYQLAYKRYTTETIKVLSALARRTYPLMAWPITFDTGKSRPDFHLGTVPMAVINSDTSLGRFLSEINRRLPFEVQNIVFGHLSGFAHCLGKTLLALDWASSPSTAIFLPARPFSEKPFEEPSVSEIGAIKTKVLGETCLARIGADDRSDDTSSLIFVNKRVTKVQISFGMYGVVGFRAMYADNSVSSWLGGPGQWCVTYECQDLTSLNIISDGFKIVRVDRDAEQVLGPSNESALSSIFKRPVPFAWNYSRAPNLTGRLCQIRLGLYPPSFSLLSNPALRLAHCIPFQQYGGGGLKSITICFGEAGIYSIKATTDISRAIGAPHPDGVNVTHHLMENEFITAVLMVTRKTQLRFILDNPSVLFRTSLKRTLHFGPYELLQASDKQVFGFRGSANSRTRGLFTEPNGIVPMSSLGVVTDRLAEKVPLRRDTFAPVARLTEESPSIKPSTCLSREVLGDDVKTLLVQRVGPRCVGLQIEHDKSQIVTLGQWDPDSQFTSVLYDEDSGVSLCALYFIYSKDAPGQRYVADIRLEAPETGADSGPSTETVPTVDAGAVSRTDAGVDEDANTGTESGTDTGAWSDPSCFAWTTLDKPLAWWFDTVTDHLEAWEGRDQPIRVSKQVLNCRIIA